MNLNLFMIHGILQVIAFAILFPLGILVAIFRDYVGDRWFMYHVTLQLTATAAVFVAVAIAAVAIAASTKKKEKEKEENKTPKNKTSTHVIVGFVLVGLICLQILWAMYFRHIVPRPIWYVIHMILATVIILLGWANLYLGYRHYQNHN